MQLKGKAIIVTGAASRIKSTPETIAGMGGTESTIIGMGGAAALLIARAGGRVMVADIDRDGGQEIVADIRAEGGDAAFVHVDITDDLSVQQMVRETIRMFGRIDGAFNNVGVMPHQAALHEMPLEVWHRDIAINLTGTFLCMKHEIAAMLETGGGAIVNNSSLCGLVAFPGTSEYTAAKHGVIGLTKAAAIDYGSKNIRINVVAPGSTRTPMNAGFYKDHPDLAHERAIATPLGYYASPFEIAEAAAWLLSDSASFITGVCLPVDGGLAAKGA